MTPPTPSEEMIPTRLLIISDTHGHLPLPIDDDLATQHPFHAPLPSADVLIHCGDLTMNGRLHEHQDALELLTSISADVKIVIPGNHDITLDREYYAQFPTLHATGKPYSKEKLDEIRDLYTGPEARQAGIHYLVEGVERIVLKNGVRLNVYASAYQPEFCSWAFGYPRSVDRYNPLASKSNTTNAEPENPVPEHSDIDVMITHGPPKGFLDLNWNFHKQAPQEHCGCEHLRKAVQRCRPRVHCFGHIHEGWGALWKAWEIESRDTGDVVDLDIQHQKSANNGCEENDKQASPSPIPPYHPKHNPSAYYMYPPSQESIASRTKRGEILMLPDDYHPTQVSQMCAKIDATELDFGRETLFVNASIMNLRYRPVNAPWVVDLMLPRASVTDGKEDEGG